MSSVLMHYTRVRRQALESRRKGIAQRYSKAGRVGRTEFKIVVNHVEVSFRANKEMAVKVVAEAAADVTHEVIAADEVGTSDGAAINGSRVETKALPADAGHHFSGRVRAQLGSVDPVKIIEKRAVGLEACIEVPTAPPGQLAADSQRPFQKQVRAEDRVGSAGQ